MHSDQIDHAINLFQKGSIGEAYKLAMNAPSSVERFRLLVTILVGRQQPVDIKIAQKLVRKWIRNQPRSPEPWIRQLEIHLFNEQLSLAKQAFSEIKKRAPRSAQTYRYKALLLQLSGHVSKAHLAYRNSIRIEHEIAAGKTVPSEAAANAMAAYRVFRTAAGLYPGSRSKNYLQLLDKPAELNLLRSSLQNWEKDIRASGIPVSRQDKQLMANAWHGLGLSIMGDDECISCFQNAMAWKDDHKPARSNALLALNYSATLTDEEVFDQHIESGHWFQEYYPDKKQVFENARDPQRVLSIGYLSSDLREHPVMHFILPVLENHDRDRVKVYVYYNHDKEDSYTNLARDMVHQFLKVKKLSHAELSAKIIQDRIDILVDLNGYTGNGRIPVLAERAAPVQMCWIGYPNTTGLDAVDYRIVDEVTDPSPDAQKYYSEQLLYMPRTFSVYSPLEDMPSVVPSPCLESGIVTFGSFNNLAKINEPLLDTWAKILLRVPGSRLTIKDFAMTYDRVRQRILDSFMRHGIKEERIQFKGHVESRYELFEFYQTVDISLDSFPYNGTTTTCESLFMGIPVVTRAGHSHRSRVGASQLGSIGLQSLVAGNEDEYIDIAVSLSVNRKLLKEIRDGLREKMQSSPLMDAAGFTFDLESAYREVFAQWCEEQSRASAETVIPRRDRSSRR